MAWLTSKIGMILGGIAAGLAFIFYIFQKGKSAQRQKTNAKTIKTVLEVTKKARENEEESKKVTKIINKETGEMEVEDARDRLRKNWSRD